MTSINLFLCLGTEQLAARAADVARLVSGTLVLSEINFGDLTGEYLAQGQDVLDGARVVASAEQSAISNLKKCLSKQARKSASDVSVGRNITLEGIQQREGALKALNAAIKAETGRVAREQQRAGNNEPPPAPSPPDLPPRPDSPKPLPDQENKENGAEKPGTSHSVVPGATVAPEGPSNGAANAGPDPPKVPPPEAPPPEVPPSSSGTAANGDLRPDSGKRFEAAKWDNDKWWNDNLVDNKMQSALAAQTKATNPPFNPQIPASADDFFHPAFDEEVYSFSRFIYVLLLMD